MNNKTLILVLLLNAIFFGCNDHNKYMDEQIYSRLQKISPTDKTMLIYYFDGDCSMCLAKVKAIEQFTSNKDSDFNPLFIAKTMNGKALQFNLNQLHIKTPVYQEKYNEFEKLITFNKITQVSKKRIVSDFNETLVP